MADGLAIFGWILLVVFIVFLVAAIVVAILGPPKGPTPSQPGQLSLTSSSAGVWTLSWTASATGTPPITYNYQIQEGSTVVLSGSTAGTSVPFTGALPKTTYNLSVTASNTWGTSSPATSTVTTGGAPAFIPSSFKVNIFNNQQDPSQGDVILSGSTDIPFTSVASTLTINGQPVGAAFSCLPVQNQPTQFVCDWLLNASNLAGSVLSFQSTATNSFGSTQTPFSYTVPGTAPSTPGTPTLTFG